MKKPKVALGIPVYGTVSDMSHVNALQRLASLNQVAEIRPEWVLTARSMATDSNRNAIVRSFLETDAEWLLWWDHDHQDPIGTFKRLYGAQRSLIGGLYVSRGEPYRPIAYRRADNGLYSSIPVDGFTAGEIIQVDAGGMHTVLSHRQVYEDIARNYITLRTYNAGEVSIHRDDLVGDTFEDTVGENDGKVIDGVWQVRVRPPEKPLDTLWFIQYLKRTEDMFFFECAQRVGHMHHIDTSVILGHMQEKELTYWTHLQHLKGEMNEDIGHQQKRIANNPELSG